MTRRTYHFDEKLGQMVEGPAPRKTHSGDGYLYSDRIYSATPFLGKDGEVIDSRKKHRDYMKRNGLTTMDDFTGHWARKAKERAQVFTTGGDHRARREAVERAIHKLEK